MSGERWTLYFCEKCGSRSTDHDPGDCGAGLRALTVVPEQAVADAVRAERERIVEALQKRATARRAEGRILEAHGYRDAAYCVAALSPADGNTEEEG